MPRVEQVIGWPVMNRKRIAIALATAIITDAIQFLLGPLGVTFADEILDVIAMAICTAALGFHPLLLPTFLVELVPVVDLMPTWTGCVLLMLALKRRPTPTSDAPPPVVTAAPPRNSTDTHPPVIDV